MLMEKPFDYSYITYIYIYIYIYIHKNVNTVCMCCNNDKKTLFDDFFPFKKCWNVLNRNLLTLKITTVN